MKDLFRSFFYAWRGLLFCINNERNMRIHITVSAYMFAYILFFDFFVVSRTQLAILLLTNALVFMAEIINTSVENTVNMLETKFNKYCEIAKDTAAGAVFIGAVSSVAVGIAILGQPQAFLKLFDYYVEKPWMIAVLAASLILSVAFISSGPYMILDRSKKKNGKGKNDK